MQFERIPNARSQRFLTDVHTHRLTATISVYPAKFTKTGSERRHFSIECNYGRTRAHRHGRQTANRGPYHIILANGQRFTMFFYVMHTTERHRDYTN